MMNQAGFDDISDAELIEQLFLANNHLAEIVDYLVRSSLKNQSNI
jgi:hypothetical protein